MKYLCLIYVDDERMKTQTAQDIEACMAEQRSYLAELEAQGHGLAAYSLQPPAHAACLSVRAGKLAITDGPFAETSEHFGGFFLIDARDFNDAIRIASKIPLARHGWIEVRPLR